MPTPRSIAVARPQRLKPEVKKEVKQKNAEVTVECESRSVSSTSDEETYAKAPQRQAIDSIDVYRMPQMLLPDVFCNTHKPLTSSFLKPNSSFIGSQQSGRSIYEVRVDLKEVDLDRSFLTGFLTIHGLTQLHPEITTFFRGEIIGPRYSFFTGHRDWGSSKRNDLQHWGRFPSWRNLDVNTENDLCNEALYKQSLNDEFLYMRWKEIFLVPDARIKDISGASFAGFYYICYNQLTGSISGLYFHKCSDKFQQLELSHIPDGGISPSYEYA